MLASSASRRKSNGIKTAARNLLARAKTRPGSGDGTAKRMTSLAARPSTVTAGITFITRSTSSAKREKKLVRQREAQMNGRGTKGSTTLIDALIRSFRAAMQSAEGTAPPAALLWTDPDHQWISALPTLRAAIPEL